MNDLLMMCGRTILVLLILFGLTKCIGKKQISQMNIYDYIIGITIGSIAADISLDIEKDIVAGVVALLIYGFSGVMVTVLTLKYVGVRKFINGTPTILINRGKIMYQSMKREGIDVNDLEEAARQNGYFDLTKIHYAVLEISGKISFLAKAKEECVTNGDMKIKKKDEELCANLVIDGVLLEKNLLAIHKDKEWLDKELKKRGYDSYERILLLICDRNGKISIYDKNMEEGMEVFL